jgi:hypothetical protein
MPVKRISLSPTPASEWLRAFLAGGPKVEHTVLERAIVAGFTWDDMRHAAGLLHVRRMARNGGGRGGPRECWCWMLGEEERNEELGRTHRSGSAA